MSGGLLIDSFRKNRFLYVFVIALLLVAPRLRGQEPCDEEVKLLLLPTQVGAVVPALKASGKTHGRIYFYDTPALDLLSKGVILRLREHEEIDLTAKLRPISKEKITDPTSEGRGYKCEVDLNDGVEVQSYSVENKYSAAEVPKTGQELLKVLSVGQKKLLAESQVKIDWKRVRIVADIQSTMWTAPANAPLEKLSLELWKWQGGSALEVSTRGAMDTGQVVYRELRELANKNGLGVSPDQHSKTSIALAGITGLHPH